MPIVPDTTQLGELIRSSRKLQLMTQSELGREANVGLRFISELERGKETIRFAETLRVLHALGFVLNVTVPRSSNT